MHSGLARNGLVSWILDKVEGESSGWRAECGMCLKSLLERLAAGLAWRRGYERGLKEALQLGGVYQSMTGAQLCESDR